jgi:hypothetical protein
MCKVGRHVYPVTANEEKKTLTWRGTTFHDLKEADCAKGGWTANSGAITLCGATQGGGNLTIGKDDFDCQMPHTPAYREWLRRAKK